LFKINPNSHLSNILRIAACAVISTISFWCPYYFAGYYEIIAPGVDHRLGFFMYFIAFPFSILAAIFCMILLIKLFRELKSVRARWRYLVGFLGVVLAIPSISGVILAFVNIGFIFI
jgi:hypothetical protein